MFAKLYGDDDDQVLVKVDSNVDGRPEIRFFCQPEGFGVCSLAVAFTDDDAGWEKAEKALRETTEEKAREICRQAIRSLVAKEAP